MTCVYGAYICKANRNVRACVSIDDKGDASLIITYSPLSYQSLLLTQCSPNSWSFRNKKGSMGGGWDNIRSLSDPKATIEV